VLARRTPIVERQGKNVPINLEHALLTRIIHDGDFHSLEKARIDESFFMSSEAREVYRYLRDQYHSASTTGLVPSLDMVTHRFPAFYPALPPDAVPLLCEQLRYERVQSELMSLAQELTVLAQTNPMEAKVKLHEKASVIASISEAGHDMAMATSFQSIWDRYNMVANCKGMLGIPYPWQPLNEELQGMQDSQFIVLYGRPKSMKTWMALYMAVCAYKYSRRRVLFYSGEMSPDMLLLRAVSILAEVDYRLLKNGQLQPEIRDNVFQILFDLKSDEAAHSVYGGKRSPYFIVTTDRSTGSGGGGVAWLQAKIRELEPDIVFVDGMYLMNDDRGGKNVQEWQRVLHISRDLKKTARGFNIPVIGVTQANRNAEKTQGEDLTELAYSDALGQDADAVMRVTKKEVVEKSALGVEEKKDVLFLNFPGLREAKLAGMVINARPGFDFSYIRSIVDKGEAEEENTYGKKRGGSVGPPQASQFRQPAAFVADPRVPLYKGG
jgi:replicative DNA helicase